MRFSTSVLARNSAGAVRLAAMFFAVFALAHGCASEPKPDEYRDIGVSFEEPTAVLMAAVRDVLAADMTYEVEAVDEEKLTVSTRWKERDVDKDGRMRMGAAGVRTKIWARITESIGKRFVLVAALREVNTSPHGDDIAAWGEVSFDDGEFARVQALLRSRLGRFIGSIEPSERLGEFMRRTGQLDPMDDSEVKPLEDIEDIQDPPVNEPSPAPRPGQRGGAGDTPVTGNH